MSVEKVFDESLAEKELVKSTDSCVEKNVSTFLLDFSDSTEICDDFLVEAIFPLFSVKYLSTKEEDLLRPEGAFLIIISGCSTFCSPEVK